jgi:hypothetical protein
VYGGRACRGDFAGELAGTRSNWMITKPVAVDTTSPSSLVD